MCICTEWREPIPSNPFYRSLMLPFRQFLRLTVSDLKLMEMKRQISLDFACLRKKLHKLCELYETFASHQVQGGGQKY